MATFSASPSQIGWGSADAEAARSRKTIDTTVRAAVNLLASLFRSEVFTTRQKEQCQCFTRSGD
jgi:hypothetical protein